MKEKIDMFSTGMAEGYALSCIYDQGYESAVANRGFIVNLIVSVLTVVAILLFFIGFKNGLLIGSGLVFSIFCNFDRDVCQWYSFTAYVFGGNHYRHGNVGG